MWLSIHFNGETITSNTLQIYWICLKAVNCYALNKLKAFRMRNEEDAILLEKKLK